MNHLNYTLFKTGKVLSLAALALASGILVSPLQAQVDPYTMVDANVTALVDVGSSQGMYDWSIGGQNQLNQQWFWYRTAATGPQYSISSIAARSASQPSGNRLNTLYTSAGNFSVEVDYTLHGYGTGKSDIDEAITIQNLSGSTLDFYFFQYSDFNLGAEDEVFMDSSYAFQQSGANAIAEGIIDPASDAFEAKNVGGASSTLYKLTNVSGTTLDGTDYAIGDVTWAYEWHFSIAAGESASIIKDKALTINLVPEPSALSLLVLGVGAWLFPRRRSVR
jgi:large repetitive protein